LADSRFKTVICAYQKISVGVIRKEIGIMILSAGDKVRIVKDAFENTDISIVVTATKGSIGTVLSYIEYCDYLHKGAGASEEYFLYVKKGMDAGTRYPIRFVKVVMPPKDFCDDWRGNEPVYNGCKVRRICLLGVEFFEKI
jgi:hypothetical protein